MSFFPRVIPVLTYRDRLLVKPLRFGEEKYIGDPINAVRIFNEKQVDEIILIDLSASEDPSAQDLEFIEELGGEAFMPVGYGGGVDSAAKAKIITSLGIEKVIIGSAASQDGVVRSISEQIGSQSTVVSIDYKKRRFSNTLDCYKNRGADSLTLSPLALAEKVVAEGAGELIVQSITRERSFQGYEIATISEVSQHVNVPVVALGGARGMEDFRAVIAAGASAAAAGSAFILQGRHEAVLITYPSPQDVRSLKEER